jgi:hypothetical protein
MTRHTILFAALLALLLFVASDAQAVDTTKYPAVLVDQTCTDANDTVTGQGAFSTFVENVVGGGPNGKCDHDNRILTGALVADTVFGPLPGGRTQCIILRVVPSAVTGGDTKWRIILRIADPLAGTTADYDVGAFNPGVTTKILSFGVAGTAASTVSEAMAGTLPNPYWLELDLETATSWTGNIYMARCS